MKDVNEPEEDEHLEGCAQEPETDIGNGRRYVRRFAHRVCFVPLAGSWHVYNGMCWSVDEDGLRARGLAHETAEAIEREVSLIGEPSDEQAMAIAAGIEAKKALKRLEQEPEPSDSKKEEIKQYQKAIGKGEEITARLKGARDRRWKYYKSSCGTSKLSAMMNEAKPELRVAHTELDQDPFALNIRNGTLRFVQVPDPDCPDPDEERLIWTVQLDPHDPTDMITKVCAVDYDPDAACPIFDAFLDRVQPDNKNFLQRYYGYNCLGLTDEEVMVFHLGAGRNGKSTFIEIIAEALGDYARKAPVSLLTGDHSRNPGAPTPELVPLLGARLVRMSEPESNQKFRAEELKAMTGAEPIYARRMQSESYEFTPEFKITLTANHKPVVKDDDDGTWRRILLVDWPVQIPKHEVDRALRVKLRAEMKGILAWMVRGTLEYLNHGLQVPDTIANATSEYRDESDPIGQFVRQACDVTGDANDRASFKEIFGAYERYAEETGVIAYRSGTFSKKLAERSKGYWDAPDGSKKRFQKGKSSNSVYHGLVIKPDYRPAPDKQGAE